MLRGSFFIAQASVQTTMNAVKQARIRIGVPTTKITEKRLSFLVYPPPHTPLYTLVHDSSKDSKV